MLRPIFRWMAVLLAVFLSPLTAYSGSGWAPLRDESLVVEKGSPLDFSAFRSAGVAGAKGWAQVDNAGHIRFRGDPEPTRFLIASLVPSEPNGGLPTKEEADAWVEQLVRTGYTAVRLHFIDAVLMTGRKVSYDYDPVALDRLYYLMAKLKAEGIYWIIDGMSSDNGAMGDVQPHRWVDRHDLRGRSFYEPEVMTHWKRMVLTLWGRKNPYTGVPPLADPAMLGVILVNEHSLAVHLQHLKRTGKGYPKVVEEHFAGWLASKYREQPVFEKAWGREVAITDRIGQRVALPGELWENSKRAHDFAAFVADVEISQAREMEAYLRSLGFRGLASAFNVRSFLHADLARDATNWVDMHAYQTLLMQFAMPGSKLEQSSIFDDVAHYARELSDARQWGKPFTVTEYGHPFWNRWRHESAVWMPAFAAFQQWDGICQFAELPVLLAYGDQSAPRRRAIFPFGVGGDPIARAGERLAALLYLRGDVAPARGRVNLSVDSARMFEQGNAWRKVPEGLSRLALVSAMGLGFSHRLPSHGEERGIDFPLDANAFKWIQHTKDTARRRDQLPGPDYLGQMRKAQMISATNRTNVSDGVFETDNGQIFFDAPNKRLTINTDRTVAIVQRSGTSSVGGVEVRDLSGPVTLAVSALDGKDLGKSRKMLVFVLTNALNTDMEFSDPEQTTLKSLGSFPPRIQEVSGWLSIRNSSAGDLAVWSLDQAGRRLMAVPSKVHGDVVSFSIHNVMPGLGPVTYFEIAEK